METPTGKSYLNLSNTVFYSLLLLVALPVWIGESPAMIDFPQHIAQLTALKEIFSGNEFYSELYEINWFTPYIVSNFILLIFSSFLSPLVALKLGVTFYLIAIPVVTGLIAKKLGKPVDLRLITIPFLYCFPFNWGFVPFLITVGFGIVWVYYFISFNSNPNSLTNIIISIFIIYSHAIAWGVVMLYITLFSLRKGISFEMIKGIVKLSFPVVFVAIWMYTIKLGSPSVSEEELFSYFPFFYRFCSFLVGNLMGNDTVLGFLKLVLIYFIFRTRTIVEISFNIYLSLALATVMMFFVFPNRLLSTGFFSDRLLILFPVLMALSIDKIHSKSKVYILVFIATTLSVTPRISRVITSDGELMAIYELSEEIEDRQKLIFITNKNEYMSDRYRLLSEPQFLWLPQLLATKKDLEIDFNFAYFHPEMVRFSTNANEKVKDFSFVSRYDYPNVSWANYSYYDYVLIRDCSFFDSNESRKGNFGDFVFKDSIDCWNLLVRKL